LINSDDRFCYVMNHIVNGRLTINWQLMLNKPHNIYLAS